MQAATARPIERRVVEPAQETDNRALNPTATRYGWCPFGDINLVNADGTINMYVQPLKIGESEENPYHRRLPKGQLIPFPTFAASEMEPSADLRDARGRAVLVEGTRTITAKAAAELVLERYSAWGFVLLDSLQGVDQETAFRIFSVVQPLEWPLSQLDAELSIGAASRIPSAVAITFPDQPGYSVQPLANNLEREIARKTAEEMRGGVSIALTLATSILNDTETSMTTRHSGGFGKTGPDPLDQRLSEELGRPLPRLIGQQKSEADSKLDFLVNKEIERSTREELDALREENARLQTQLALSGEPIPHVQTITMTGSSQPLQPQPMTACGHIKSTDGQPCQIQVPVGGRCHLHKDKE